MARPKLQKIRLIYTVEGNPLPMELDLDPARVSCLFLEEHATVEILGGFYEKAGRQITREEAIARFGIRAEAWFPKGGNTLPLDKAFMKRAWGQEARGKAADPASARKAPRADGTSLPMVVLKDPSCMPTGEP